MALTPTLLDDITPIKFEVEIPATVTDIPADAVLQRVYVDANTRAQNLMVSVVFDDATTQLLTVAFNTTGRGRGEWSIATTKRWMAVRIQHVGDTTADGLTDIVEIFGIAIDVYIPTVTAALASLTQEVGQ